MSLAAYERVKLARDSKRPTGLDYIKNVFGGFIEFHGDRRFADDPAVVGGIAKLCNIPVTVIAIEKGHTAKERSYRNFGMPQPEGYRKALRLMRQAEKFGRPVICFVDTSGAYRVWMLQNAVYSVISPEGCASILWKDAAKAEMAAASLKLAAEDAKSIGVIERILSENDIGKKEFYDRIRTLLMEELKVLSEEADLIQSRYDRFRKLGVSAVVKE